VTETGPAGDGKRPKGRTKIATETKTLKVGDPAPDFTLRAHDGRTITLSALRGQRVVIAFMAFAFSGT
jgi:peroxiredoxin